jgi:hypothetical protein
MMTRIWGAAAALTFAFAVPLAGAAPAKLHKLVGTVINWNGVVTAVPAGTSVIDTASIKCANASGCIISVAAMIQAISNGSAGQWQICVLVDGNQAGPGCPVQGIVPTSNYVVGNLHANATVATGTHTVQTEIVMPSAGSYAAWESDYTVYKN